jgi:hypothetical protein
MKSKMTRRQLAGAMLVTAAAAQGPPSAPANPPAELDAARQQNQRAGDALGKVSLPMDTEPAFHFTA